MGTTTAIRPNCNRDLSPPSPVWKSHRTPLNNQFTSHRTPLNNQFTFHLFWSESETCHFGQRATHKGASPLRVFSYTYLQLLESDQIRFTRTEWARTQRRGVGRTNRETNRPFS